MPSDTAERMDVTCCIAGGGPAGIVLGFLLARAGVEVLVLEKHKDFLRDFRGDTIHPSTLELMYELGLLDEFLKRPHQEAPRIGANVGGTSFNFADFSHLPTHCKFIAFMPQWDFLNFIAEQARKYPAFHLRMEAEVTDLLEEDGRIAGVRAQTATGPLEVRAALTVAADGRGSIVREKARLQVHNLGAPMDVLWTSLPWHAGDPELPMGTFDRGLIFVMIYRGDYWQCGFVIRKGGYDEIKQRGLEAFRARIVEVAPFLRDRVEELNTWDDVHLLTVKVDRLRCWHRPGLLCIGDAAHAMSPVGGVGINLAIQDAVAAANILAGPLREGAVSSDRLDQVQRRRELPTRLTQWLQVLVQNRVIGRVLGDREKLSPPWMLKLMQRLPILQRIPARAIGMGFRPEHVKTHDMLSSTAR